MYRRILNTLLFMALSVLGFSSNQDSTVHRIFIDIYNQDFQKAGTQLEKGDKHLNHFYSAVLNIDLLWWKYSSSHSKSDSKALSNYLDEIEPKAPKNQNEKIIQLISKSYRLRLARKKYKLFDVIGIQSDIKNLLAELNRNDLPLTENQLKLFDLYMCMFSYFEKVNPFFIKSTADKRKKELLAMKSFANDKDLIIGTMGSYFLGRIYQKVEDKPELAKIYFERLSSQFPKNMQFKEHLEDCKN